MNEIKVGDKVCVREDAQKLYTDNWYVDWNNNWSVITVIEGDAAKIKQADDHNVWTYLNIPQKYLVKAENGAGQEAQTRSEKQTYFIRFGSKKPTTLAVGGIEPRSFFG